MSGPRTVIVTQRVTAEELYEKYVGQPIFVSDGIEAPEPGSGIHTTLARSVRMTAPDGGDDNEITIHFYDDVPPRTIHKDDTIEVHMLIPGIDSPGIEVPAG